MGKKVVSGTKKVPISEERIMEYAATRAETVLSFTERAYRISFWSVMVSFSALLLSIIFFIFKPEPRFFLNDMASGRIVPVVPVSAPNMNNQQVMNWFKTTITEMLTFHYGNYREVVGTKWREALAKEKLNETLIEIRPFLERVISDKIVLFAVPASEPVIVRMGKKYGVVTYLISMDVLLVFDTGAKREVAKYKVDAEVRRVDVQERPNGLEISWFAMVLR